MNEKRVITESFRAWTMRLIAPGMCMFLVACAATTPASESVPSPVTPTNLYPSTYKSAPSPATLIRGATILTGTGTRIDGGDVLIVNGRIETVGQNIAAPDGARIIEGQGRWVTPGLIDVHSQERQSLSTGATTPCSTAAVHCS
jgi:hypothetical protein